VRLECLVKPLRGHDTALRASYNAQFARFEVQPMPPAVFDLAADLRATFNLKTPDALHAASAIQHGCDELWTNDQRLAALSGRLRTRVVR
jgi:predicted nucleic acid-binding protein